MPDSISRTLAPARRLALAAASLLLAVDLAAQTPAPADTVAETRRLRDAGEFAAAAALIAPYARTHADRDRVAWLAAQTLYWAQQPAEARPLYERALEIEPVNIELRLDFGRFLVETGEHQRAREVLEIALDDSTGRARAHSLLGTIEYWNGDLRAARRSFIEAVRADSSLGDARQQLVDIETAAASSIRGGVGLWHDDQPLDRFAFEATGTWYADPLTPFEVRARSWTFDPGGSENATVSQAEVTGSTYLPSVKLDASAAAGVVQRSVGSTRDLIGRIVLGMRLSGEVRVRGRFERTPYTNTVASLFTETMVRTLDATAEWRTARGWQAEAVARQERFPADNVVGTGYAWLLAPLVRRTGGDLRAGYSFAIQDSKRNTFIPRRQVPNFPPGQEASAVDGIYAPYYTPRNLQAHSVLAAARVERGPHVSWNANGSYGVSAHDDAPVLFAVAAPGSPNAIVRRTFYRRSFRPWTARATLDARVSDEVAIGLSAERGSSAFYDYTTAGLQVTWTFRRAAIRRAEQY